MIPITITLCLLPLVVLGYDVATNDLGADPAETVVHFFGQWTIRLLLATLTVSSVARLARWPRVIRIRRTVGLATFGYGCAHLIAYGLLLGSGAWALLADDIAKRPYITAGFTALLLMTPLAVTSTRGWQRRLGAAWKRLHRLIYVIGFIAIVHITWLAKASYADAVMYGTWYMALMIERVWSGQIFRRV